MVEPTAPTDWLTRLMILFGAFILGLFVVGNEASPSIGRDIPDVSDVIVAQPSVDMPIGVPMLDGLPAGTRLHLIENIEVIVMESYPMQVSLNVSGYIPDGCSAPTEILQSRDGNMVVIRVFRNLPPDAICTAIAAMYSETIRVEGGFESGHYTFDVNGLIVEVDL